MKERVSIKSPEISDPHPFVESPMGKGEMKTGSSLNISLPKVWAEHTPIVDSLPSKSMEEYLTEHGTQVPMPPNTRLVQKDGHIPKDNHIDKDTNPKDVIATNKVPLSLVPEILSIYAAMGFLEGALKYGRYNWRIAGVRSSIYIDALKRHIAAYESGEDISENGVHHLSNALACIGIILDSRACGKLNDDRPPRAVTIPTLLKVLEEDVARLREKFKDHHPHQYTIKDGVEG